MLQYLKWLPRFGLKHLLIAVVAASVSLTAYVLILRSQRISTINDVYGNYEVYQLLCNSPHYELFQVNKKERENAIDWQIPEEAKIVRSGITADRITEHLRKLLTTPQNLRTRFAKDFVFSPTVRLRTASSGRSLDIYFCFTNDEAAIVHDGQHIGWFPLDNIANELNELLGTAMVERSLR